MPQDENSVMLGDVIREFGLEILNEGENCLETLVQTFDVNRPGLPLSGFFDYFDDKRLMVIGLTENSFLETMSPSLRQERFDRLFSFPIPALIFTRGLTPHSECLEMASKYHRTVLRTAVRTSSFVSSLMGWVMWLVNR